MLSQRTEVLSSNSTTCTTTMTGALINGRNAEAGVVTTTTVSTSERGTRRLMLGLMMTLPVPMRGRKSDDTVGWATQVHRGERMKETKKNDT